MKHLTLVMSLAALALVVAACAEQDDEEVTFDSADNGEQAGVGEETIPTPEEDAGDGIALADGFEEIRSEVLGSFESRPILPSEMRPPVFHVATDDDELETGWEMYQLEGDVPEVDWEHDSVLFMALAESGSCPWEFRGLSTRDDELFGHLVYDVDHPDDEPVDCTADDIPRTFVVSIAPDSVVPDKMTVRLVHDDYQYFPLQTDTRDMPLNSIDPTRHEYPFTVWQSEPSDGAEDSDRVVERAEVVALDEMSLALRFGFRDQEMVPDIENPDEFEILEPGPEYVHTVFGMRVRDASPGFLPPDTPDVYTAPYRDIGVAGRDYHPMMVMAMITLYPRADDVDERSEVELTVPLQPDLEELTWDVSVVDGGNVVQLMIQQTEGIE